MRQLMATRVPAALCQACRGSGQDQQVPTRGTSNGSVLFLIRPCVSCEGHGIVLQGEDMNLGSLSSSLAPVG